MYYSRHREKGEEVNLYGVKATEMGSTLASKIMQNYLISPLPLTVLDDSKALEIRPAHDLL